MKIWKASLILFSTIEENFDIRFIFEEEEKDYKINQTYNEYIHSEGWVVKTLPMKKTIVASGYSGIKVIQGFDHELKQDELKKIEVDMRKFLMGKLNIDKEAYLQMYQMKIDLIQSKQNDNFK